MTDNQKRDYQIYFLPEGDPNFSEKRNRETIKRSIRKYEAIQQNRVKAMEDKYGERADAVITFLRSVSMGKDNNIEKYFGRRTLAMLRGDEIKNQIMSGLEIRNKDGIIIKRAGQEMPYRVTQK